MLQIQFFLPLACLLAFAAGRVAAAPATGRLVVNIVEAQTSKPVACNVYLTANGKAIFAPNCPRWERDGSFACDGRFAVEAPAEKIEMTVERGPEWESCALTLECEAGTTKTFTVALTRWIDMNARGWFSGDLHVHRPVEDMPLLMRASDLNVAPVLTFWNNRKVPVAPPYLVDASEKVSAGPDSPRPRFFHTLNQEDEREGGALLMFNLREPVAVEEVYRLWPSGMAFHRPALQQGAHVEQEKPFWWEAPVNVALGKVASMEVVHNHFNRAGLMENEAWGRPREVERYPGQMGFCLYTLDLYYRYLNLGWDIPVSAGSASGVLANPLGYCRLYVQMDRFDYNDWFDGFRAGRSFATNGPMLFATVNGQPPGSHFDVEAGKPFEARVSFEALCREPLDRAEIVVGGNVAATIRPESSNAKRILGEQRLSLDHSAWIAVRVFEAHKPTVRFAHSNPSYVTVGGQKRRDPEAARFYAQWLGDLLARTEQSRAKFKTARHCEELIDTYRAARKIYQDR